MSVIPHPLPSSITHPLLHTSFIDPFLYIQGADLDKNFQIVFPKKVMKEDDENVTASTRAANAHAAVSVTGGNAIAITERDAELMKKYLPKMPKTMDDCRILMEHLAQHNMVL